MPEQHITSPGRLLDLTSAYWKSCTLHAGVMLGIFSTLATDTKSVADLATRLSCGQAELTQLLNALTAMGLLIKVDENYTNTEISSQFLDKNAPGYLGYIIMHHHHLVDGWAQLADAVRHGGPVEMRDFGEEQERESFLFGMHNLASANAPNVARQIDLKDRKHLLDLGGGPGTYAIAFCRENPGLRATIFDRPGTERYARQKIEKSAAADRISFVGGDFTSDPLAGPYDVAWLSQILHSNGPKTCRKLLQKTVQAMEPGGQIMIHEFFLNDTMAGPLFPALFSLNMLINNGVGRSYSAAEVSEMLTKAGASDIHRLSYQGPNDSFILCATV
jgi:ubiquinone/menaquinone biosynthesis C-methylase UbiE